MRVTGVEPARSKANTRPSTLRVYQFRHTRIDQYWRKIKLETLFFGDLAGARTQDHLLKREVLYQLSYQVAQHIF